MHRFRSLLMLPSVQRYVGRSRLWYYLTVKKRWKAANSAHAFDLTTKHNLKKLRDFSNQRIEGLIKPLSVLEFLNKDSDILVIGPRNENDLLKLVACGFSRHRIRGLDLMSYSPLIDVGDMHQTPYEANRWDAIVCGWTLSYSGRPDLLSKELIRIAKPGCAIAIAVEYFPLNADELVPVEGYAIGDKGFKRINSVDEILRLFDGNVEKVYFSHDAPLKRHHNRDGLIPNPSMVAVIFTVRK